MALSMVQELVQVQELAQELAQQELAQARHRHESWAGPLPCDQRVQEHPWWLHPTRWSPDPVATKTTVGMRCVQRLCTLRLQCML
jgi:hypothetical protein